MIRKLFLISLLANLGLVAAVAYRVSHRPASVVADLPEVEAVAKLSSPTPAFIPPGTTVSYVTNESRAEFSWGLIETADYKKYIANLRAVGCPEETIRDIIIADVTKNYARRGLALQREQRAKQKYWQNDREDHAGNPNSAWRQMRTWGKERIALLKELLGPDVLDEMEKNQVAGLFSWGGNNRKEWAFLPADKRDLAQQMNDKYQELVQEVYFKSKGDYGDETQAQIRALQKQKSTEMAAILSPQELEDYELRQSQTAQNMRYQMEYFKASEDEYRKIFKSQKTFDEQFADYNHDPDDLEGQKKWQEANKVLRDAQKAALGERATAYARSQDNQYQQLVRLTAGDGMQPDVADKVYDIRQAVEDAQNKLRLKGDLTPDQLRAAMKQVSTDAQKTVAQLLGEKIFSTYRNSGGIWLYGGQ